MPNDDRHPIIYAAVVPASIVLFAIAAYIMTARPGCAAVIADFDIRAPLITRFALAMTQNAVAIFLPPLALTGLMVWFAARKPTLHALCVVMGCVTLAVGAGFLFYTATIAPLITLITNLSG